MRNDLRFAIRQLLKNPGFTAVAVLTLALGIGANTAIFSVINAVLLRPLPFPSSERLVQISQTNPRANRWGAWVSYPDFLDWRQQNTTFEEVGAFRSWGFNLTGGDRPEVLRGVYVSASLFTVLKQEALLGRTFLAEENLSGGNHVAVLSHRLWQRRFGADPSVIGKSISIDTEPHTVVSVMPASFTFPQPRNEIWIPHGPPSELKDRGSHNFRVVARLRPGVTLQQAQSNLDAIARGLAEQYSEDRELGVKVTAIMLPPGKYSEARQQKQFVKELIERIQALPGVEAVGGSTALPFFGNDNGSFQVQGHATQQPADSVVFAEQPKITPDYFAAMKIRLRQGRNFTWADDENAPPVAIVSEGLVRAYWPAGNAIGKWIKRTSNIQHRTLNIEYAASA